MNKFKILSLLFSTVFFFINCKKQNVEQPSNNNIKFEQMAVGQKSKYVLWYSENFDQNSDTTFKQTTDTLTLTVYIERDGFFWINEVRNDSNVDGYYYSFSIKNDTLRVDRPPGFSLALPSRIIFQYGSFYYDLKGNNFPQWNISRWGKPINATNDQKFGKIRSIKIMGKTYNDVFIYYNTEVFEPSAPTVAIIYSKKEGFISFQYLGGGWRNRGVIYNLISD